ncbi:DUF3617 domain-containing protein [Gilvimarinus sp. 1_MG-2023]|uniref:DUF3617 domain-containing protein n=1 Tax=Gilvimarinus sp. 1_MG-2023 TaxID=3062638 RepID=UPI0026E381A2|nr:DUF3617 domain-containing protein [Gilvimarinus sp. 1_MG-2023]MDO6746209.1 DUF3617 domain-containing protein [Gilvimarinus sp. 1_MG-2023]
MKAYPLLFACALTVAALPLHAETPTIKPGLWQNSIDFSTESGELEKQMEQVRQQLAQLPEAQKQMMANMLKSQGLDFDLDSQTFKTCLSPERAAEGQFTVSEKNDCQTDEVSKVDGKTVLNFSCDGEKNNGSGSVTFHSDEHYAGQSQSTTEINGKLEQITVEHSGKWLGTDCGNIQAH